MSSLKKGFTLIELLVVIAIIALFATVVIGYVNQGTSRGRNTRRATNLDQLVKAINIYYNTNGSLPVATGFCGTVSEAAASAFRTAVQPYLKNMQYDPTKGSQTGDYVLYATNAGAGQYRVCANMEAPNVGNQSPVWNAGTSGGCVGAGATTYNYCLTQ
jgi:prepilin-type N-terminal cleavage/methylation domain-containing protein